jgi:hypothetical protein
MSVGETLTHRRPSREMQAGMLEGDASMTRPPTTGPRRHTRHSTSSTFDSKTSGKTYPETEVVLTQSPGLNNGEDTGIQDGPLPYTEAEDKRISRKIDWVSSPFLRPRTPQD